MVFSAAAAAAPPSGGNSARSGNSSTRNNHNVRKYLSKIMILSVLCLTFSRGEPLLKVGKDILMGGLLLAPEGSNLQGNFKWKWLKVLLIGFYLWLKGKTKLVDLNVIKEPYSQVMRNFMGNFHICFLEPGLMSQFAACC